MDLKTYCQQRMGLAAQLARDLQCTPVMISEWANSSAPPGRGPSIEFFTSFAVTVEESCPSARWVRVKCAGWPKGKPLQDHFVPPRQDLGADTEPAELAE